MLDNTPHEDDAGSDPRDHRRGDAAPDAAPESAPETPDASRELVLVKHGQRFVFRCAPGEEASLLDRLGDLVRDPNVDLSWFDAAVLSHQVGQHLGRRLEQMRKL